MRLKQEFLDMVALLNPSITADSYDGDYTMDIEKDMGQDMFLESLLRILRCLKI